MTVYSTNLISTRVPPVAPAQAGIVHCAYGETDNISAALAADDIIKLAVLPARCLPVDLIVDSDDLDSNATPTLVMSAGILNSAGDDLETELLISGSDVGQAGGIARMDSGLAYTNVVSDSDRTVAIKVGTGAATANTGKIRACFMYRAVEYGY